DAGQRVWLVTAAPVELGRVIAARLGLTGALGTVAEVQDGAYTGRLVGDLLHGHAVAVNPDSALRREARRRNWEVRDFRTGRKAAKVAVPATAGAGLVLG